MFKFFMLSAAAGGFLGVALGAFGAHGLRNKLSMDLMHSWETAVQYQLFHSLALMIVGLLWLQWPEQTSLKWSGFAFVAGIVLFSGSLYLISLTNFRMLGILTPVGGLSFLAGWMLLAAAVWRNS